MKKTAGEIANVVLQKLANIVDSRLEEDARRAAQLKRLPINLGIGTGVGVAGGLGLEHLLHKKLGPAGGRIRLPFAILGGFTGALTGAGLSHVDPPTRITSWEDVGDPLNPKSYLRAESNIPKTVLNEFDTIFHKEYPKTKDYGHTWNKILKRAPHLFTTRAVPYTSLKQVEFSGPDEF